VLIGLGVVVMVLAACVGWLRTRGMSWQPLYDEVLDVNALGTVQIAGPSEALTFAREANGRRRVLAVTAYRAGMVDGVDLAAALDRPVRDPLDLFAAVGYDALRDLVNDPPAGARVSVRADALGMPLDLRDHHIAAATNFPEHAGEVEVEEGPFLFPKLVAPTGPRGPVPAGEALLDYETEVGFVLLSPLTEGAPATNVGLILANDFTDRATLLRHVNVDDVASGEGFATGKSFPGYLPVGDLFVIPRDVRAFADRIQLRLYVNGRLRQRGPLTEMIWDLDEIIAQTWARKSVTWDHRGESVALLEEGNVIGGRTLILSGTPQGTVFTALGWVQKVEGLIDWLLGGWRTSIASHAIDNYIHDARAARIYLQPGDTVTIHVDYLGVIVTEVVR
jgi:2-keto-4-pentenoate hydratase/2-oxohepta-3-ene-1,7-dioic acid hydratase in catechol pathway